jgi:hypothetical protein
MNSLKSKDNFAPLASPFCDKNMTQHLKSVNIFMKRFVSPPLKRFLLSATPFQPTIGKKIFFQPVIIYLSQETNRFKE